MYMRKRRIAAGLLAGVLVIGGQQVWAATTHYNDSSVTGGSQAWQQWVADWNQTATDFTKVSLTPGGAASELNFERKGVFTWLKKIKKKSLRFPKRKT